MAAASWKKSIWTKCIAASFIGLVILGNIWLVMRFTSAVAPVWMQTIFMVLVGSVFVFGAALGAERLLAKVDEIDERDS